MQGTRVLHVLDHSLPLVSGYSVRSHYMLRAQRELEITPIALTSPRQGYAAGEDAIDGVRYLRVPTRSKGTTPASQMQLVGQLARRLTREVRERRIALVHAHSPARNLIPALWAARRAGIPVVYEIRSLWEEAAVARGTHTIRSPRYRAHRTVEGWLMRRANALAVISRGLVDEAIERGVPRQRIFQVPNGVDTDVFRPIAPDEDLVRRYGLEEKVVFGFVGSFLAYEGLDILLRAFTRLASRVPHARLVLVGDGEAAAAMRADTKVLDMASRVIFAGATPHREVQRWYSVCDILVYPRRSSRATEMTTPLKPLEAMAMGKAVVASDVGGLRELIRSGDTGLLCPPNDADELARILVDLAGRAEARAALGTAARRFVCAERDWKHLVRTYEQAYRHVLDQTDDGGRR